MTLFYSMPLPPRHYWLPRQATLPLPFRHIAAGQRGVVVIAAMLTLPYAMIYRRHYAIAITSACEAAARGVRYVQQPAAIAT